MLNNVLFLGDLAKGHAGSQGGYMSYRYDSDVLDDEDPSANFFIRHWRGHLSLPVSWFLIGGLLSAILIAILVVGVLAIEERAPSLRIIAASWLAFFIVFIVVRGWALVGIWRSAGRHEARGGSAAWANIARALLVVGLLGSLAQGQAYGLQVMEYGRLALGHDSLGEPANVVLAPSGREVTLSGVIALGTADKFEAMVAKAPNLQTINLESPGGRIWEAQRIAAYAKRRGLETHVERNCESACTFILLAGKERWIAPKARVGFHQPSFAGMTGEQQEVSTSLTGQDYIKAGIASDFVDQINATPPESMWYPSHAQMIDAGVISGTEVVVRAGDKTDNLAQRVATAAAEVNRAGQSRLDEVTTRTGARAEGRDLLILNEISVPLSASEAKLARAQMRPLIVKDVCKDASAEALVAAGATITLRYQSKTGRSLFDIPVSNCV